MWITYSDVCPAFLLSDLVCCAGLQANLHALIQLKPALSHLGDKGLLLLLRWVFTTTALLTRHDLQYMIFFSLVCSPAAILNKLLFLLFRFLSIPKGFSYLNERGYVSKQLDKWQKVFSRYAYNKIHFHSTLWYFFTFIWLLYYNKTTH